MQTKRLLLFSTHITRLAATGRTYLWTFTLREAVDYTVCRIAWNRLLTYLRRRNPSWSGVRVYEVHPGKWGISHGLHVHVLTNRFHDIQGVRSVCLNSGWGRCHVTRVRKGREFYVMKYLSKTRPEALKGWRLVATFGMPDRSRMSDIICEGLRPALMRLAARWARSVRWNTRLSMVARWEHRYIRGEWCAAVAIALHGQKRFRSRGRRIFEWVVEDRVLWRDQVIPGWKASPLWAPIVPLFDPFQTHWGRDIQKQDFVANKAAQKKPAYAWAVSVGQH